MFARFYDGRKTPIIPGVHLDSVIYSKCSISRILELKGFKTWQVKAGVIWYIFIIRKFGVVPQLP